MTFTFSITPDIFYNFQVIFIQCIKIVKPRRFTSLQNFYTQKNNDDGVQILIPIT